MVTITDQKEEAGVIIDRLHIMFLSQNIFLSCQKWLKIRLSRLLAFREFSSSWLVSPKIFCLRVNYCIYRGETGLVGF